MKPNGVISCCRQVRLGLPERKGSAFCMNYRLKLYINSIVDLYSDIVAVDLENGECKYIYVENGMVEELKVPYTWAEAKILLLSNIHPDDRQKVLDSWNKHMVPEAEPDSAFAVTYKSLSGERGRAASEWKMNIAVQESDGRKLALIFSRDHSMEMKDKLHLDIEGHRDNLTSLYTRFKLDEMIRTEYRKLESCGVLYFDINDFKSIKEVYGNKEEEEILAHISDSIKALENPKVLAYRYGKDDFIVIAKDYSKDAFRNLINFWMDRWKNLAEGRPVEYTVAMGNAWDCAPVSVQELIAKAEGHMFRNKKLMKSGIPMDYYLQEEITSSYGLFGGSQFFKTVDYKLKNVWNGYCLVAIDIEHFKLYNKWWGRQAGDEFLADIATVLKDYEERFDGVAAYIGGDNFAILLPDKNEIIEGLTQKLTILANERTSNVGFLPALGVYHTGGEKMEAMVMYDRATEAQAHVFGNYEERCCVYEENMTKAVEQELNLIIEAKEALERRQFFLVLQPKCRITTGKIVGAEALVRWRHPAKGMISPGAFIPVLERNGFITDVDLFVWEEVCRKIRSWMDEGIEPVPISINVSRIDMLSIDVANELNRLVAKYEIEKKYVKVEITESAYVDDADQITETVQRLQQAGFILLMDDFGSGYSSLNMLRNVVVDIIKIDMKFLDMAHDDMQKGQQILKSVINMSREMKLPIIVEGVETQEQADFLKKMNVKYAQGFLFYRPMEVTAFTELLSDENKVDHKGINTNKIGSGHFGKMVEGLLEERERQEKKNRFSKTPGGFFSYNASGEGSLTEVDKSIAHMFGCKSIPDFLDYVGNTFKGMVHPEDWERVEHEIKEQIADSDWKMDYVEYRIIRKDGRIRYIKNYGHLEEGEGKGNDFFRVFLLDVTNELQNES